MTQVTKRARITMHVLLDLMLNGQLKNIGRESGSSGFSSIRLDPDEIAMRLRKAA